MKKKIIVAIVLVLLLSFSLTMLVGCDEIFTRNEERDAKQVVATVTYKEQSANIYKFELASQFNSYAYAYHSYYNMSYKEAADYILRSLAQQKLLVMFAKEQVAEHMGLDGIPADIKELLSNAEYNKAIEDTNDSLLESLKTLVKERINEDNFNTAENDDKNDDGKDEKVEVTDPVLVRFYSNGGTDVERQRIQKGTTAEKPEDPTKEGYTFYGWYLTSDFQEPTGDDEEANKNKGEFNFDSTINNSINLYAKWVKYTAPRTDIPEVEEDEDADYDPDANDVEISAKFFDKAYLDNLAEEFKDEDFVEDIKVPTKDGKPTTTKEAMLNNYIDTALDTLKSRIKSNLFVKTEVEGYNYSLNAQMETLLVTKLERVIGESATVTNDEIEAKFNEIVAKNKQTFTDTNESAYQSALTSKLSETYFHKFTDNSYGFVVNILLKLPEDSLKELTDFYKENPANKEAALIIRNRLISEMTVKVSNPEYDAEAVVKDPATEEEIELRDPMTDPKNPYNNEGGKTANTKYQKEGGNNYNQLISFEKGEDGKYAIVFGATEHPAMAYLLEEVPAFDKDDKVGIIHQIHNSLKQVTDAVAAGDLSKAQGVYWLREVATKWLYLVGDDSGAVTDSSNNKGLGYLVTPEGEDSSFLEDFTDYARDLIKQGTGAYSVGATDNNMFLGDAENGSLAGNGKAFVVADSFIGKPDDDSQTTDLSNAYAGVFVLLNSYTVWDKNFYAEYSEGKTMPDNGELPKDYIITFAENEEDIKTIEDVIKDTILEAKKKDVYNLEANTMGLEYSENGIQYFEKAYKSLWKDLD